MTKRLALAVVLLAGGLLAPLAANATSISWTGTTGNWSDSANWLPASVPGPTDVALIDAPGTYTVTLDADVTVQRISLGNSSGTQTLDIDGQVLTSSISTCPITFGGVLVVRNGGAITGGSTILNQARIELDTGSISNLMINQSTLETEGTCSITNTFSTTGTSLIRVLSGSLGFSNGFVNKNQILLAGTGAALSVTVGTLVNDPGAFILASGTNTGRTLGGELDNRGTVSLAVDLELIADSADHLNSGSFNCLGGSLLVTQSGTTPSFENSGTLSIDAGVSATIDGGSLDNTTTGTILGAGTLDVSTAVFSSAGEVAPGESPGILDVTGDYDQTASGDISIEIGGLTVGTEYDRLAVSGAASLDGNLDAGLIGGYEPLVGDVFTVLTASSVTGGLTFTGLEIGNGLALVPNVGATDVTLTTIAVPDNVAPVDPGECITSGNPCLNVPFAFTRVDVSQVRGYSVTFTLSPELQLCAGVSSIVEGPFLTDHCGGGCTFTQIADNGGGSYTFDATILGANCGPSGEGTLFSIDVAQAAGDGTGTITVDAVTVRDCDNQPVPGAPGASLDIEIDLDPPVPISDLTAAQVTSGNDTDGTTEITVSFSGDEPGTSVEVYRKAYGDYPLYASGSVPTVPIDPADAVANGWTLTSVTTSGETDEPTVRDFYYYVAFVLAPCDGLSIVSNMSNGSLNYHLGDVSDGLVAGNGNNVVGVEDLSLLGANYFKTGASVDSIPYLDFGPTVDFTASERPTPDNNINFEELILMGINFGVVGIADQNDNSVDLGGSDKDNPRLVLSTNRATGADGVMTARLRLEGNRSLVKGVHSVIEYDASQLEFLGLSNGGLLDSQSNMVFAKHQDGVAGITFDAAIIGQNLRFEGSGDLAVLSFRIKGNRARPSLATADLRDSENNRLIEVKSPTRDIEARSLAEEAPTLTRTQLLGAAPNPFQGTTRIGFSLPSATRVSLRVHDIGGRLVRTIADGEFSSGEHHVNWDGRGDSGRSLPAGVYLYSFQADDVEETRKIFLFR